MSLSEPPEDRRVNLTPALAVRVAIVGSLVLALFAIIFFRLWFLQVLTGSQYVEAAAHNTTRVVAVAPPRGKILSRGGKVLVSSTTALAVEIDPTELPVKVNQSNILTSFKRDDAVYDRLAHVIGKGTKRHPCTVATPPPNCNVSTGRCPHSTTRDLSPIACIVAQQIALNTYADVTVKSPVSTRVQYWIDERANEFRGVEVEQTSVSGYPYKDLAAQTLGTVGRLTSAEGKQKSFKHVNKSAVVGQSGLEYEYDQFLRGTYGKQRVRVNAQGVAVGEGGSVAPKAGDDLKTTLDLGLQQVGQSALQHAIDTNNGLGGAFVAMDPQNGQIYGMGSLPSFNPSIYTHQESESQITRALGPDDPLFNRATQSQAPDGSTFKVITSTAALQSGTWTPDETYDDTGEFCPDGPADPSACKHNSGGAAYGVVNLATAIKVSDDVFFYHLGDLLNIDRPQGGALQKWAKLFGIGQNPHVDLPPGQVADGTLPTPALIDRQSVLEKECETATGAYRYSNAEGKISATKKKGYHRSRKFPPTALNPSPCAIGTDGVTWTVGDNINTAVGQGEVQVSPLQLAMVYSAIENGGTIVRPHLGEDIQNAEGTVLQKLSFPAQRHLKISSSTLDAIQTGLHEAAQGGGPNSAGTSQTVMQNFGKPVYGKTGTAQYIPTSGPRAGEESDYAWYSCYVPASATSKPIEVVVWVEGGGFGAIASAPVARQILSQWFYGKPGPWIPGDSDDQ